MLGCMAYIRDMDSKKGTEMTYTFNDSNTDGYTAQELTAFNAEFNARATEHGFDEGSDEYIALFQAFSDEVSRR